MREPEIGEVAAAPDDVAFPAPPTFAGDQARTIFRAIASHGRGLLRRYVKVLCLVCVMALLLPALLIVSAFSLVLARVLGVPLFSSTSTSFSFWRR